MENNIEKYDKQIFEMMANPSWWIDKQKKRKLVLLASARTTRWNSSISKKMGALLIWQQVLEQFLKEIIEISIGYIKAEIWPTKIDLKVDFERKTFGQIIADYENFSLDFKNKQKTLDKLRMVNKNRNEIVHKIFNIDDLVKLEEYFASNFKEYENLLTLLLDHYTEICYYLEDLKKRVDWDDFLAELEEASNA